MMLSILSCVCWQSVRLLWKNVYLGLLPIFGLVSRRIEIIKIRSEINEKEMGASLVAQGLGICLPMQGTRVQALVGKNPACRGAAGPVSHSC